MASDWVDFLWRRGPDATAQVIEPDGLSPEVFDRALYPEASWCTYCFAFFESSEEALVQEVRVYPYPREVTAYAHSECLAMSARVCEDHPDRPEHVLLDDYLALKKEVDRRRREQEASVFVSTQVPRHELLFDESKEYRHRSSVFTPDSVGRFTERWVPFVFHFARGMEIYQVRYTCVWHPSMGLIW